MNYLSSKLYENKSYGYFVLGILTTVYSFNVIDRQLLVILQESIMAEMGLSDTQLGLLSGLFSSSLFLFLRFNYLSRKIIRLND